MDPQAPPPVLRAFCYGPERCEERELAQADNAQELLGAAPVTWLHVSGLGDRKTLLTLGEQFGLHNLVLEDIVNIHQRSKVEHYGDYVFIVLRTQRPGDSQHDEQLSLVLGQGLVLSFAEGLQDDLEPVRRRVRDPRGRMRSAGADYLAYALIDAVVDHYFPVLEAFGERLEQLEDAILTGGTTDVLGQLHALRGESHRLRRTVWPLREAIAGLQRDGREWLQAETLTYLRDCQDHAAQLLEIVESQRELASGLMELHLSSISNRMNEIMKVLTIMASLFIPLSFVAGLYGMNFDPAASPWNMPELGWYWGYPFCLTLMAGVALSLLGYFRRKGWIGGSGSRTSASPDRSDTAQV